MHLFPYASPPPPSLPCPPRQQKATFPLSFPTPSTTTVLTSPEGASRPAGQWGTARPVTVRGLRPNPESSAFRALLPAREFTSPLSSSRFASPCADGPGRSRRRPPRGRAGPSLAEQGERGVAWRPAGLGQAPAAAGSYSLVERPVNGAVLREASRGVVGWAVGAASCLGSSPPSSCVRVSASLKATLRRKLVNKLCGKASFCLQVVVKFSSFLSVTK